jgi:CRISPR-associated endonuclease Cas1
MAASAQDVTSVVPRIGVVTLFGYGIKVYVERGHLILEDGIGAARRRARLPRVGHGLRRLVVIGSDGFVSLAALRWLADQDAAFVMLERNGRVLATTGPVRSSDARLRRAQALALRSDTGLQIARELIDKKLAGQEQVARDNFNDNEVANRIARFRVAVAAAKTVETIRLLESQAAAEYWSMWSTVPITFARSDLRRTPEHWRVFGSRSSPLSGSPRSAANPVNAVLNYVYAVLESEARLSAAAMGLDPGLGVLHLDSKARDSLASDLMEPVRPQVDGFVLDWIRAAALKRDWFFEERDGNCRLMGSFAAQLSETALMWRRAVAPFAEFVAHTLWSTIRKADREAAPATRLTQSHKRVAKGQPAIPPAEHVARPQAVCRVCGQLISPGRRVCSSCAVPAATEQIMKQLPAARIVGHGVAARARQAETQRRNIAARRSWDPGSQPKWLNEETYATRIQPLLTNIPTSAIATALGVSWVYSKYIRLGQRRPHPRHWQALAQLVGVAAADG